MPGLALKEGTKIVVQTVLQICRKVRAKDMHVGVTSTQILFKAQERNEIPLLLKHLEVKKKIRRV